VVARDGDVGGKRGGRGGKPVVVVGGCCVDTQGVSIRPVVTASSNPAIIRSAFGGVGRNIAETIARLGHEVHLHSVVADDEAGRALMAHFATVPLLDFQGVRVINGVSSAQYLSINNNDGDLVAAVADMAIFSYLTPESVSEDTIASAAVVVVDGNLPVFTIKHICQTARKHDVPVFFEPTSVPKSVSAAENGILSLCTFTSPNEAELAAMASAGIGAGRDLPIL
jgi:sugar/nucleoside kinase (ribokinase family)